MGRGRTLRTLSHSAEASLAYEPTARTTRFNVVVSEGLKRAIDALGSAQGISGAELARRLLDEGVRRLHEEEVWRKAREIAPLRATHDRAVSEWLDAWNDAWERKNAAARRRR